jgi:hypothetical protein
VIGWVTAEEHEKPEECPECIGYDNQGRAFAIFWKGQRIQQHPDATRSDMEATQGIARLILNWEKWTHI